MSPSKNLDTSTSTVERRKRPTTDPRGKASVQVQAVLSTLEADVRDVYTTKNLATQTNMLYLRQMIFDVAADTADSGSIIESVKWGQASYATKPRTGSPLRIAPASLAADHDYELLVVCTTTLIADFQAMFPKTFATDGRRAIHFHNNTTLPQSKLAACIEHAITLYSRR